VGSVGTLPQLASAPRIAPAARAMHARRVA